MKWLIQRFILQMDNYPLLINRNIKVHIRIKTFLKKSKRGRVRQVERNSITGGGRDLPTLNILFPCEHLSWKFEKKKSSETWKGRDRATQVFKEISPHTGWGSVFPWLARRGFSPTQSCMMWNPADEMKLLHFAICSCDSFFFFVCSKKCFKYKGLIRWRLIMNSLPLLNVSSQPNVRGYSVRGYWADWKCQTGRKRE